MAGIVEVLAEHRAALMAVPGVLGTAIGIHEGHPCILVFVLDEHARARLADRTSLGGHPVKVEVSGPFRPRPDGGR